MTVLLPRSDIVFLKPDSPVISIAGAGGKTTLMFDLAKKFQAPAVLTTTTKVGADQITAADICMELSSFPPREMKSCMWISPSLVPQNGKILGCNIEEFSRLAALCREAHIPLVNEADGAAHRHIKAPGDNEPVIPKESDICIYVAGLDVLGKPMNCETVHRPEIFSSLTGLSEGDIINSDSIIRLLEHPKGGLKNIPEHAVKIVYLTHVNSRELLQTAEHIASKIKSYDYLSM